MGRIAAIDYGTARIGIALSDPRQCIAQPLTILAAAKTLPATAQLLVQELAKHGPLDALVIGLPLHLNGKESPMSQQVRAFAELLKPLISIPIHFSDERLTTALVERALKEDDMSRKKRKGLVDALTATVILQNHLDSK